MKKIIYILSIGLLLISSCSKPEVEPLFDKLPEERMLERNAELTGVLLGGENGWKAFLKTSLRGGGYGFYMDFDDQNKVTMVADWDDESAKTPKESTYRVQYISNSTLIFDTYTYITILQDPNNVHNGGTQKEGLQSDIEFEYTKMSGDTVFLTGRKYRNTLYLIKATEAEQQSYSDGVYDGAVNKTKNLFATSFPRIVLDDGGEQKKIEIGISNNSKLISSDYLAQEGSIISSNTGFAFTLDGLYFVDNLVSEGIRFAGLRWKGDDVVVYDVLGREYAVEQGAEPGIPLDILLGVKYKLQAKLKTINPGMTSKGEDIIKQYVNNLDNRYSGYVFNNGTLTLTFDLANRRLTVDGWHNQNGNSGWTTTIVFDYIKDESTGEYSFTRRTAASGGYVSILMTEEGKPNIQDFLLNNKIKIDYYAADGIAYGRMTSVTNPDIVVTWDLIQ